MLQLVSLLLLADSTLFLATLTGYYRAESCISSTISQSMSAVSSVTCRLLYVCFRRRQPSAITDWSFHLVVAVDSVILLEHSFNQYNLRSRLLNRTNLLTDKSFIIRMLYKTVILFFFVQWLVLYTVLRFVKGFFYFFLLNEYLSTWFGFRRGGDHQRDGGAAGQLWWCRRARVSGRREPTERRRPHHVVSSRLRHDTCRHRGALCRQVTTDHHFSRETWRRTVPVQRVQRRRSRVVSSSSARRQV